MLIVMFFLRRVFAMNSFELVCTFTLGTAQ